MEREKLKQHRALSREIHMTQKQLDKLYDRSMDIPVVVGKVRGSSRDFPYTEIRTSVLMDEPVQLEHIGRLIRRKEQLIEKDLQAVLEIEEYINTIPDPETRQIFEMSFYEGLSQRKVAQMIHVDQSTVSRKIEEYLKLHRMHQKNMI